MKSSVATAFAAALFAMISIQVGVALAKQIFADVGASGAAALRVGLAALMLAAVFRPWRAKLKPNERFFLILFGAALGGMNLTFYWAVERIPLGIAVALEFTGPLAVAFWSSRRILDVLWATLAGLGIWLILPIRASLENPLDPLGVFFAFLAGLFWALYIVFGHRVGRTVNATVAASTGMLVAAVGVVPFGLPSLSGGGLTAWVLLIALAVALFSSALPYLLEMVAMRRLPKQTFAVLMSLEPAIAALSGLAFLNEQLSGPQWMAISLVVTASLGSSLVNTRS